ncbi:MAG: pilus assembly protein [Lachnospiraceae bacterium]|nr:pilus assembly protein [Lachnospiraceae bacterium]
MLKRMITRFKDKCGAVTVEALVSFVGFLFVIITILNVANYCRAQMVISNAVDAAAREMAQYSYFYEMSGMKKFNDYVNDNAGVGAANLNDVIDGTSSVYTTLSKALSDTSDSGNLLADKIDNQTLNFQDIQSAVLNLETDATNILSSIDTLETTFNSVERNPLLYAKSLAAVATEQGLDIAKSYVIAAPLAKLFTQININSGELSVQQYLENLGIVGGLDGLNFKTSTMFSSGEQDDIHIRCYYRISLCNFVDRSLFDVPICKEAVCGAWLGGDDNHVKVSQKAAVQPMPDRSMPEMADVSGDDAGELELLEENPDPLGDNSGQEFVVGRIALEDDDYDDYVDENEDEEKVDNKKHKYYATYEDYLADFAISEEEAKELLDENGVFVDPDFEKKYQKYVAGKIKKGETPRDRIGWKEASGYWTEYSYVARGNKYNKYVNEVLQKYDYSEVVVEDGDGNRYRLDGYSIKDGVGEIVSRKAIDLERVSDSTFIGYLEEIEKKYRVGYKICATDEKIQGKKLSGNYYLEIPASNMDYENLDHFIKLAEEYNVTLCFAEEGPND